MVLYSQRVNVIMSFRLSMVLNNCFSVFSDSLGCPIVFDIAELVLITNNFNGAID